MESRPQSPSSLPPRPYEPIGVLRWLYRRFFAHITVDERWSEVVRQASQRGTVVYVMRSLSFLDFLCLDFLVKRFGLPLVRFVNDLGLWILEPFGKGERRLQFRGQVPEDVALSRALKAHFSALLFLRRPSAFARSRRHGEAMKGDLLRVLVRTQREIERPILLVPQTFVWSKRPSRTKRSLTDLFFGPSEWPGKIRVFFQFLLNYRNALLRSGEPFDLASFLGANADLTDEQAADKVRYALLRRIERERLLVLGPSKKTPMRLREEMLRSQRVQKHMQAMARTTGRSLASVEREADKELRKLCAAPNPYVMGWLHRVLSKVIGRIYSGLVVDREGLERVRAAAREGTLVFIPSHKSHVDYLVLSEVLYSHAISPPVIAAGDNLSFWPLGPILRRGGAFFIRRSFRGRKLYSALVEAYIRKLMVEGFNVEFFIEGGRSRTGKLLPPKLGLLSMIVDAALLAGRKKVLFVPVSIGYERIMEERSYVHELAGGDKQKENLGELLKAPRVLSSKYGRLYLQFGEILPLDSVRHDIVLSRRGSQEEGGLLTPSQKRTVVQRVAHQVVYQINRVTIVTPAALVATALLAHRRRGIPRRELTEIAAFLLDGLRRNDARIAHSVMDDSAELRHEAVTEAMLLFAHGRLVNVHGEGDDIVYTVPEERRIALEYYKNNILHFFIPSALVASAVLVSADGASTVESAVRDRVQQLSRLFKHEFVYQSDATFDEIFDHTVARLLTTGQLVKVDQELHPAGGARGYQLSAYASMIRTYFESYRLALRGVDVFARATVPRKEWLKRTLSLGQRMYLAGEIEQRESIARPKLENALQSLRDFDLVHFPTADDLQSGPNLEEADAVRDWDHRLGAYLTS